MNTPRSILLAAAAVVVLATGAAFATPPNTTIWEGEHLAEIRRSPADCSQQIRASLDQLEDLAEVALRRGPYSVTDKELTPPSGDKHDYMSFSRYWWPNPETDDGLPYVRRDGHVNHELLARGDRHRIGQFYDDLEALALAAYLLDEERYGPHAAELVRAWFLSPETRMNPNLRFAQAVPGVADGRAPGVIDTRHFLRVLDSVAMLEAVEALERSEVDQLRDWFSRFLSWLQTSEIGQKERRAKNNHGAWFAAQAAGIAWFVGDRDLATSIVEQVRDERLPESIADDGSLPEELKRTRSLHYTLFSLSAFATAARVGEHAGVDLWDFEAPSGASLRRALDFVAPYAADQDEWRHPMLDRFTVSDRQSQLFHLAATRLKDPTYLEYLERSPNRYGERRLTPLLFGEIE